mgnify:CR=1 FL=1
MRHLPSPAPASLTTPLLTVEDAAQVLKVSRSKMYELNQKGLPTVKIDGKRRVLPSALAAWVEAHTEYTRTAIPVQEMQKARSKRGTSR